MGLLSHDSDTVVSANLCRTPSEFNTYSLSTDFVNNWHSRPALLSLVRTHFTVERDRQAKNLRLTATERFADTSEITLKFPILIRSLPGHHFAAHSGASDRRL